MNADGPEILSAWLIVAVVGVGFLLFILAGAVILAVATLRRSPAAALGGVPGAVPRPKCGTLAALDKRACPKCGAAVA